jgi:restriction system protein
VCWHKVAARLAEHYHVVLPDLRGYGDSSLPDPGPNHVNYTFRAMAQDMVEVEPTCSAREGTVMSNGLPWDNNSWEVAAEIARRHRHPAAAVMVPSGALTITTDTPLVLRASSEPLTQLLLRTVVAPDQGADKGKLIVGVLIPWFDIIEVLKKNPSAAFEIPWDKWEEIIAGAYKQSGFENVILTPRSGDYGRDVIAEKKALGTIRIIDSVKAFTPPNLVTADHVRALAGVLQADGASKGFLTTTSDFAPMIRQDPLITKFFPDRLELVNGEALLARLQELAENKGMARI